jgi:hypothetical protein
MNRLVQVLLSFFVLPPALAQIPAGPNCTIDQPPADAGAYVTPGGFLLVYPRNASLPDDYTGCKMAWVVDAPDRFHRLMILYFERGKLRVAQGYDGRSENQLRATCKLPDAAPEWRRRRIPSALGAQAADLAAELHDAAGAPRCAKEPD